MPKSAWGCLICLSLVLAACGPRDNPSGRLAFVREDPNGMVSLWIIDADGGNLGQLIAGVSGIEFPSHGPGALPGGFSRGGQILAFRASQPDGPHLYCADMTGKRLIDLGLESGSFDLALDGAYILVQVQQANGGMGLTLVSTCDGQDRMELARDVDYVTGAFSPDGRYVLVNSASAGNATLKLVNVPSLDEVELLSSGGYSSPAAWFTPDGHYVIAYMAGDDVPWRLYTVPAGRESALSFGNSVLGLAWMKDRGSWLTSYGAGGLELAWSERDGITGPALVSGADQYELTLASGGEHALAVVRHGSLADFLVLDTASHDFREILVDTSGSLNWGFSPDGRFVAVVGTLEGSPQQAVIDTATDQRSTWPADGQHMGFAFSPDSQWLAYSALQKGQPALYLMNMEANTTRLLLDNAWRPIWSR